MNVNSQDIAAMRAITISREYGSGGDEIAARLARRLGWQLIDHGVIVSRHRSTVFSGKILLFRPMRLLSLSLL